MQAKRNLTNKHFAVAIVTAAFMIASCKEKAPISGRFELADVVTSPANVFREKSTRRLITGSTFRTNHAGVVVFEVDLVNGLQHGTMTARFDDGKLSQQLEFLKGVENGWHRTWYANGQIRSEGKREDGKLSGDFKEWDGNGKLLRHGIFENGNLVKIIKGDFPGHRPPLPSRLSQ